LGRQIKQELPSPVVIIGDDLTGCCDSAAPFAGLGARTIVTNWQKDFELAPGEVRAICTASRHDDADEAAAKVRQVAQRLPWSQRIMTMKKVDSTLKGNIASEVAALMEMACFQVALVAPAFPEQQRTVQEGFLQAPGIIAKKVHVPSVLRHRDGPAVRHFSRPDLDKLSDAGRTPEETLPSNKEIWTFDVECSHDLERIVDLAELLGGQALPVGSAGLTYALSKRWQGLSRSREPGPSASHAERCSERFVVLSGSENASTIAQLDHLEAVRGAMTVGIDDVDSKGLLTWPSYSDEPSPMLLRWDWSAAMHAALDGVFANLAQFTGTLVLIGGDTAQWFVDLANVGSIEVLGDVERGISWGKLREGPFDSWQVITKAGGFGDHDVLVRIYDRFSERPGEPRPSIASC